MNWRFGGPAPPSEQRARNTRDIERLEAFIEAAGEVLEYGLAPDFNSLCTSVEKAKSVVAGLRTANAKLEGEVMASLKASMPVP